MKINEHAVTVQTNFESGTHETVLMEFAQEANSFLLNNLIKQYKNPYLAAFREYTSNARDAHRKHGITRPIEVTLPNALSPMLRIRDFGLGLTREELKGFGQFGKSDKRDSNEYTGGFGLGSKSGLAVASQFTVTSVRDGKRNVVVVGRREDGLPTMTFMPETDATDAESGTEVSIPTSDGWRFTEAINNHFFLGWAEGTILVDNEFPAAVSNVYDTTLFTPLGDDLGWKLDSTKNRNSYGLSNPVGLVNGVRYEIDLSVIENINRSLIKSYLSEIVVNLDNGEVEIHPSRESLIYDARTRKFITERIAKLVELGRKRYADEIDQSATRRDALKVMQRAMDLGFGQDGYTYHGKPINFNKDQEDLYDAPLTRGSIVRGHTTSYMASKDACNFLVVINRMSSLLNGKASLITDTPKPSWSPNRHHSMHSAASGAMHWAVSEADKTGTKPTDYDMYYTSLSGREIAKLGPWVLALFEKIIDYTSHQDVVLARRREIAREQRKLRGTVGAAQTPETDEVRRVIVRDSGSSYYEPQKLSDLDPTKTYVILRNQGDTFTEIARRSIMVQSGYQAQAKLAKVMMDLAKRNHVFLLVGKNEKTDTYAQVLPNLVESPMEAIENAYKTAMQNRTKDMMRAREDRDSRRYDWATYFPADLIPNVKLKRVRDWLGAMSQDATSDETFIGLVHAFIKNFYIASISLDTIKRHKKTSKSTAASPGERFPLMRRLNAYALAQKDWEDVVGYMNYVLTKRS